MTEKTLKKKKVSKKTKRSWRKFVDTTDVDKFLEEQRLEERLGVPFAKRKDEDLFAVDKSLDQPLLTREQKRLASRTKEPKCFQLLKPLTDVPDPIVKRNRVRTREERRNPIAKKKDLERKLNNRLKLKERDALRNRALAEQKRQNRYKRGEFKGDIWSGEKEVPVPELQEYLLTDDALRHTLNNIGKKQKNKPSITKKTPSLLPAVDIPHPGTSYNPTYYDHQELLASVVKLEEKYQKEEKHLNRVTSRMFSKVTRENKDKTYLSEMSEGLNINKDEKEANEESENDESALKFKNPPVVNKKKTMKTRRKQKEQKQLALELKKRKLEKKKIADLYKLRKHKETISKEEKKVEKLRALREKLKQKKALEPKAISSVKFEAPEPDYLLSGELKGNLRSTTVTGNILKDRFKSLQQRNIIPPSKLVLKRTKAHVKKIIKSDHKININAEMKKYMK